MIVQVPKLRDSRLWQSKRARWAHVRSTCARAPLVAAPLARAPPNSARGRVLLLAAQGPTGQRDGSRGRSQERAKDGGGRRQRRVGHRVAIGLCLRPEQRALKSGARALERRPRRRRTPACYQRAPLRCLERLRRSRAPRPFCEEADAPERPNRSSRAHAL